MDEIAAKVRAEAVEAAAAPPKKEAPVEED
jgi:hypothetical protein